MDLFEEGSMIIFQLLALSILVGPIGKVIDFHTLYEHLKFSHTLSILFHYQIIILLSSCFCLSHYVKSILYNVILRSNRFNSSNLNI